MTLVLEQVLNGLQYGVMLLLAAGLTLIFGIMGLVNLAHGSFYMVGASAAAWISDLRIRSCSRSSPASRRRAWWALRARSRCCSGRTLGIIWIRCWRRSG